MIRKLNPLAANFNYIASVVSSASSFMPNGISHHYDLDESVSDFRVKGLYFSFLLKF